MEAMDPAWYEPIALTVLIAACVLMGLFGAESRPGFDGRRPDRKEKWFVHSRRD